MFTKNINSFLSLGGGIMCDLSIIFACQQFLVFLQGIYISSIMKKKYMLYEKNSLRIWIPVSQLTV